MPSTNIQTKTFKNLFKPEATSYYYMGEFNKKGQKDGRVIMVKPGESMAFARFKENKLHGLYTELNWEGDKITCQYKLGKLNGTWVKEKNDDDLVIKKEYSLNKEHGNSIVLDSEGQLESWMVYSNGYVTAVLLK